MGNEQTGGGAIVPTETLSIYAFNLIFCSRFVSLQRLLVSAVEEP